MLKLSKRSLAQDSGDSDLSKEQFEALITLLREEAKEREVKFYLAYRHQIARRRYAQVKAHVARLSGLTEAERDVLQFRMSTVATRWDFLNRLEKRALYFLMAAIVAISAMASIAPADKIPSSLEDTLRASLLSGGLSYLLAALYVRLTRMRLDEYLKPLYDFFSVEKGVVAIAAMACAAVSVNTFVEAYTRSERYPGDVTKGELSVYLFLIISIPVYAAMACGAVQVTKYRGCLEPLDRTFIRLFGITLRLNDLSRRRKWTAKGNIGNLIYELEKTARFAEFSMRRRAEIWDSDSRSKARPFGIMIASVIRAHKGSLATAVDREGILRVQYSLTAGLVAWAKRDMEALTAHAPDITLRNRVKAFIGRVYPALILALGAIALPLVPALRLYSNEIHASLGILAVTSLLSGGISPSGSINDVVSKVLKG